MFVVVAASRGRPVAVHSSTARFMSLFMMLGMMARSTLAWASPDLLKVGVSNPANFFNFQIGSGGLSMLATGHPDLNTTVLGPLSAVPSCNSSDEIDNQVMVGCSTRKKLTSHSLTGCH